jgi:hypothetical protein
MPFGKKKDEEKVEEESMATETQSRAKQAKPHNRLDDPEPMERESKVPQERLRDLRVGRIVGFTLPNTWPSMSRGQVRPAAVVFCYRDAGGKPTGTVNLVVFLNGSADTNDMAGPRTRCTGFEAGVKHAAGREGEPGRWHWLGP